MQINLAKSAALAACLLGASLLAGCGEKAEEVREIVPVAIHDSDECHVCGMIIQEFPGPKGQAVEKRGAVRKFCSSAEMFGWWLQPENRLATAKMFVHDMARSDWQAPDDEHLIDASTAYYVVAPNLQGAMGVPLASFAEQAAAEQFAQMQGGQVLRIDDITAELLQQGAAMGHGHAPMSQQADSQAGDAGHDAHAHH